MLCKLKFPTFQCGVIKSKRRKQSKHQTARFCNQLHMLLRSGIPLLEALTIIKNMLRSQEYDQVIEKITEGEPLAKALENCCPPMVISSIKSAEKSGSLEQTLKKLGSYYDERAELESKMKSALIYPSFVILLCLVSLIVLLVFVLPGFKSLFVDLDADLPIFTQVIIGIGEVVSKIWYVFVVIVLVLTVVIMRYKKTKKGALALDKLLLRIRFFSREQVVLGFRTLGSLLSSGIPIVEALKITVGSSNNMAFKEIIWSVKEQIEEGEKFSKTLSKYHLFPKEAIQMLAVGENSGSLAEMLLNISDFYEKERDVFIKRFTTMLEPALTVFVGLVVGVIAIAMFMPMVDMISKLQ